jgi:uncharacterized MAPEG superfamily protein
MHAIETLPIFNLSFGGMSVETTMLAIASVLGMFQLLIAARSGNSQRGLRWNVGARDEAPPAVGKVAGRLERAFRNFMETFPFFAVAVILCALTVRHDWATVWGAQAYLAARIIYLPLYAFGVPVLRTLTWLVATVSILLMYVALFYPAL